MLRVRYLFKPPDVLRVRGGVPFDPLDLPGVLSVKERVLIDLFNPSDVLRV